MKAAEVRVLIPAGAAATYLVESATRMHLKEIR